MSSRRTVDVVVTTIFEPQWLSGYLDNFIENNRQHQVTLRIICDRKTPASVYSTAQEAQARGFKVDCPTLEAQEAYLDKLGLDRNFIPWNTDNRRNIGFLRAWESGADVLISIDDDNYCRANSDFVGEHCVVGKSVSELAEHRYIDGPAWFNICGLLSAQCRDPIYARGFPYAARSSEPGTENEVGQHQLSTTESQSPVSINAGLWLDDPDVDAISRLAQSPRISGVAPGGVILGGNTWSPVNTQNTGLLRQAIPAYYYVRMGYPLGGMSIDRFGDILSGYFVQKCAKHLGHSIAFGGPVAEHRRSPHNLFKDLYHELAGIVIVEDLLPWLQELKLEGEDYFQAYASLADALTAEADKFTGFVWDQGGRDFLRETAACMRTWLKTLEHIAH